MSSVDRLVSSLEGLHKVVSQKLKNWEVDEASIEHKDRHVEVLNFNFKLNSLLAQLSLK
jgi:hypothetical protein